ncbi:NADH-quinone oxidoreductase subunit NuoG [Buchnera aphidicola]|uniref:NADH-quinone oxidoreductase subunit NuoG n=1 Tax=Buchnera aphidicola TaxID=9 RepID=UPI0031B87C06
MYLIHINKKLYKVSKNDNLLKICLSNGIDIPYFCWHPILGSVGSCRQCAVKCLNNINDVHGNIVMSCMTPVVNDMIISTNDIEVEKFRKNIIELLMTNHPHDCPVCAEGGNCHLQDMTVITKHNDRRYRFKKKKYKNQYLGPFITHEMNRCITCYRCVRYYNDYVDGKDFGVYGVSNKIYFGRFNSGVLKSKYSGNLIEICPTGVFSDKTHLNNYSRKWDMQYSPSVCHFCSIGCNIIASEKYGELRYVENRYHNNINKFFLCDLGRFGYSYNNLLDRPKYVTSFLNNNIKKLNFSEGILLVSKLLKKSSYIVGVGSPRSSIENNFSLYKLVGKKNFCIGMSDLDNECIKIILNTLRYSKINIPNLKNVEKYDAIFIIGEDISQTASRLALSVRQAIKKKKIKKNILKNINFWNTSGIKNYSQNNYNPLFITSIDKTDLDDISKINYFGSTEDQVYFVNLIIYYIKHSSLNKKEINKIDLYKIKFIAKNLLKAKRPLIISGMSNGDVDLIKVSLNLANVLKNKNKNTGLILLPIHVNSIGISLIGGITFDKIFSNFNNKKIDFLIIMENDLYHYIEKLKLDLFFSRIKNIIVLDHQNTNTFKKATISFPVNNFFESSGTIINYEGRAQKFFQVYDPSFYNKDIGILESWRWLNYIYRLLFGIKKKWKTLDDVIKNIISDIPIFKGIDKISPDSKYRFFGQKIARSPHRLSGRTVIRSHISEHEINVSQDQDSFFSFSMEGIQQSWRYSDYIPFNWFPGWNSSQSFNKYNKYKNKKLRNQYSGFLLFKKKKKKKYIYYSFDNFKRYKKDILKVVLYYKLFGSEEISQKSLIIKQRIKNIFVKINFIDALKMNIKNDSFLYFDCLKESYCLKVSISSNLSQGNIGLPLGMFGLPRSLLGKEVTNLRSKL